MSKAKKAVVAAPEAAATADDVVVAAHKIVYGKRQTILPGTPFRLSSLGLDDIGLATLKRAGAYRAPTESEAVVAGVVLSAPATDTDDQGSGDAGQTDTGQTGEQGGGDAGGIG